jgi:hypothetical protein
MADNRTVLPLERIEQLILLIRGYKVMLDADLARLYGVSTKVFNQAVKRNKDWFPEDFAFQLSEQEFSSLRSQFVTSNSRGGATVPTPRFYRTGRGHAVQRTYSSAFAFNPGNLLAFRRFASRRDSPSGSAPGGVRNEAPFVLVSAARAGLDRKERKRATRGS